MKKIIMIAGPNGAGKTTTAKSFLSRAEVIYEFINADEIARGLAPMRPESVSLTASKLMIKRFLELLQESKSFAFETTAAETNYVKHLEEAKKKGYQLHLMFLWLPSAELAIVRVAERVAQGGHNILPDTIRRRYFSGLKNLINVYLPLADSAIILDNSIPKLYKVIARKNFSDGINIEDPQIWKKIKEAAHGK